MDFGAAGGVQPNNNGGGNANVDLMSWYVLWHSNQVCCCDDLEMFCLH
jgi:hypothetical protein